MEEGGKPRESVHTDYGSALSYNLQSRGSSTLTIVMIVVLIGKLELESVREDVALFTLCAFEQVPVALENQQLRRHRGWEGEISGSDLKSQATMADSAQKRAGFSDRNLPPLHQVWPIQPQSQRPHATWAHSNDE